MPQLIKSLITQKNRKKNTEKQKQGKDVLGLIPFLLAPSLLLSHIFVTPLILCSFIPLFHLPHVFFPTSISSLFFYFIFCFTVCSPALCIRLRSLSSSILFSNSFPSLPYFSVPSKNICLIHFHFQCKTQTRKKKC